MYCLVSKIDGEFLRAYDWQGIYKTEFFEDALLIENECSALAMKIVLSLEFAEDEFYVQFIRN